MLAKRKKKMNFKRDRKRTFSMDMISSTHTELQKEKISNGRKQKKQKNDRKKQRKKGKEII